MASKYFITYRQKEQAERMAGKWQARSEAFYSDGEGWGYQTAGYCNTDDEAEQARQQAERILAAINNLEMGCGNWEDVQNIRAAVAGRDELDAGLAIQKAIH